MITMELPEITSTVIAVISMFSVVYSAIVMKKAGAAVFLLQIQTPISIVKRFLGLSRGRQKYLVGRTKLPRIRSTISWLLPDTSGIISPITMTGNRSV